MADAQTIAQMLMGTWPARMAQGAYNAVTLPGDVYQGNAAVPQSANMGQENTANIGRVTDLAGTIMGGALGAPEGAIGVGPTPQNFSFSEFLDGVRRGVIGPGEKPGFTPIPRELVEPRGNADTMIYHHDQGMNYGYTPEDTARFAAHRWARNNDEAYRVASDNRLRLVNPGDPVKIPDAAARAAYEQLAAERQQYGLASPRQTWTPDEGLDILARQLMAPR